MEKHFNGTGIISLLRDLDKMVEQPYSIVICGGAAAIVGYGLKRFTGDIDILEPLPKTESFYRSVKELLASSGLDPNSINDGAKGFVDYLNPDFRKRVIPLDAGFKNLKVSIIGKADFITMKICAWRESDIEDVRSIGISSEDLSIINQNISHIARHSPDRAHKAQLVLSELGAQKADRIAAEEVSSLAELILFHNEKTYADVSLDEIKDWKNKISSGVKPSSLAKKIDKKFNQSFEMEL